MFVYADARSAAPFFADCGGDTRGSATLIIYTIENTPGVYGGSAPDSL